MTVFSVGLVVEDINYSYFLVPVCERLGREVGVDVRVCGIEKTFGCNSMVLRERSRQLAEAADLLVIGADAAGERHRGGRASYRQKARALMEIVGNPPVRASFAVAEPCVEAWLMSDARAFAEGLGASLAQPFRSPPEWPRPTREREAKEALSQLVAVGTGGALLGMGFEFADEIVARMRLTDSPSISLATWANSVRTHFPAPCNR